MDDLPAWRIRVLDAAVLASPILPPATLRDALQAWKHESIPAGGAAVGVDPSGMPDDLRETLAWCGLPLAAGAGVRWGTHLVPGADLADRDGVLVVPQADTLRRMTAIAVRPMRSWMADRFGCRLQAAPGIRMWLWPHRCVLASTWDIPLSGFLHGPGAGQRTSIALEAWGTQVIDWLA